MNAALESTAPPVLEFGQIWTEERLRRTSVSMKYATKLAGKRLAQDIGIRVPEVLTGPTERMDRLVPPKADLFIVKANRGHSSVGVIPIVRQGEGLVHAWSGRPISWPQVVSGMLSKEHTEKEPSRYWIEFTGQKRIRGPYFCEELILPTEEWKAYTVGYRVQYFVVRRPGGDGSRTASKYGTADRDGKPIQGPRPANEYDNECVRPPRNLSALIETAERVARAAELKMCRVDLFDTAHGPVFGELTPFPGMTYNFTPEWDARMLEAYRNA